MQTVSRSFPQVSHREEIQARVKKLHDNFIVYGDSVINVDQYHILDNEIKECLTSQGTALHFWKALLSENLGICPWAKKIVALATRCEADPQEAAVMTECEVRKQVRSVRRDLYTAQKEATMCRVIWLEENAQNIAKAAGEVDWPKKMKNMAALAQLAKTCQPKQHQ